MWKQPLKIICLAVEISRQYLLLLTVTVFYRNSQLVPLAFETHKSQGFSYYTMGKEHKNVHVHVTGQKKNLAYM